MTEYRPRRSSTNRRTSHASSNSRANPRKTTDSRARSGRGGHGAPPPSRPPSRQRPSGSGRRKPPKRRALFRKLLIALAVVFALCILLGVAACAKLNSSLPDPDVANARGRDQTTVILDRNGVQLAKLYADQNRKDVALEDMPKTLRQGVVATEDERFYEHKGVDPLGIARALVKDVVLRKKAQGGSTITQQYVKQAFVSSEKTLKRKILEAMLSYKIEKRYSKDEILELYLNTIYFGHGAYGVESASQVYFGKSVKDLTLAESAMIAGVLKSPGRYSPYLEPENAKKRRDTVLGQMLSQGYITQAEHDEAVATPITTVGLKTASTTAPYFVQWIVAQLDDTYGSDEVYRGGLTITTTLDLASQQAAEQAITETLNQEGDPSAALVSVKPGTGEVIAMVGGRDFATQQFNAAVSKGRPPGSSFKPFVLVTALANGVSPEQTFSSGAIKLNVGDSVWSVTGSSSGPDPMRLRLATEKSVNSVYAQLILQVTPEKVVETAEKMGIHSGISPVPSIALGTMDISPLEMAAAYATLAANGTYAAPYGIAEVKDADGKVIYSAEPQTSQALSPAVAYLTTDILKGVITSGTGKGAAIGRPAAGKTGTTQNNADAWFCGYTPALATAVWMGYPDAQTPMTKVHGKEVTGGSFPATMWAKFMKAALANTEKTDFTQPSGLQRLSICLDSGLAATESCPNKGTGLFLSNMTLASCELHVTVASTTMPDLTGKTRAEALSALASLGLTAKVYEKSDSSAKAGTVIAQNPAAGEPVTADTAVTLTVTPSKSSDKPTASFTMPSSAAIGEEVTLDAGGSTASGGEVVEWYWDFGDESDPSYNPTTKHSWSKAGTYEVTLQVTADNGESASVTKKITIK